MRRMITEHTYVKICVETESARERQRPEEMAIKKIARRFEDAKVKVSRSLLILKSFRIHARIEKSLIMTWRPYSALS